MVQNGSKMDQKSSQMVQNLSKIVPHGRKWVKQGQQLSKMVEHWSTKIQKRSKMVQRGSKMVQPFLEGGWAPIFTFGGPGLPNNKSFTYRAPGPLKKRDRRPRGPHTEYGAPWGPHPEYRRLGRIPGNFPGTPCRREKVVILLFFISLLKLDRGEAVQYISRIRLFGGPRP